MLSYVDRGPSVSKDRLGDTVRAMQVGVVQLGQAFPFWARKQIKLLLKVSTAHPASLVRLRSGSEIAVAPRPRRHLGHQPVIKDSDLKQAMMSTEQDDEHEDTWLRLQVCSYGSSMTDAAGISGRMCSIIVRLHLVQYSCCSMPSVHLPLQQQDLHAQINLRLAHSNKGMFVANL